MTDREKFVAVMLSQAGDDYIYGAKDEVWTPAKLMQAIVDNGREHYYRPDGRNAEAAASNQVKDKDCSGLITGSYKRLGWKLKKEYNAEEIEGILCHPIKKEDLQNGDLVFRGSPADHVGMFYKGKAFHAKGTALGVLLDTPAVLATFDRAGTPLKFYDERELIINRTRRLIQKEIGINFGYWDSVKYFNDLLFKLGTLFSRWGKI